MAGRGLKRTRTWRSQSAGAKAKYQRRSIVPLNLYRSPRYIIGTTQRSTLRYSGFVTITSSAVTGAAGTHVFSANGCFDPDNTGVGGQPRGFDQLMTLFDHYTVTGSTIEVRFANASSTRPLCAISVRDGNVVDATMKGVAEYGNKVMTNTAMAKQGTGDNVGSPFKYLKTAVTVGTFLGRKSVQSDPELKGTAASNPTEQVFYHVTAGDVYNANTVSVDCYVSITYDVVFHEPKTPLAS